jgi:hypothetical protein
MFRKLITAGILMIGLYGVVPQATAFVPWPHCYPCGKK